MSRERTASRRQFMTTTASAVAAATILPRHVLGGPGFVAPSDKVNVAIIGVGGQGRSNLRSLLHEADCQVIAIADPCEEWDLSPFYYGGKAGRGPIRAEIEEALPREDPQLQVRRLRGLPGHAGEGEGDRRRPDRHPGPPPRLRLDPRDEGRQARLLREAADSRHLRKPAPWPGSPGRRASPRRWATRGARARGIARPPSGSGTAPSARSARCRPGAARRPSPRGPGARRALRRCRRASTGTCGWGPASSVPYNPAYAPFGWRGYWAFGGGALPDLAIHHLDPAFNALRARHPADRGGHGLRRRGRGGLLGRDAGDLAVRRPREQRPP